MPDEHHFRQVMGHFATGVTVVTSRGPSGEPRGLTANSVASVSLDPLLVLVCLDRTAASHACVTEGGAFGISILRADQRDLARRFAVVERSDRFEGLDFQEEVTGSPILEDALAWMDCTVHAVHPGGDHSIVVGEVAACGAREGVPLLFYRGRYRTLEP